MIRIAALSGQDLLDHIPDLAALRIAVFSDFPYLYDGSAEYEARYLRSFSKSERAVIIGAFASKKLVGAATAAPLRDHVGDVAEAFAKSDYSVDDTYYFAESVLLPENRGQGIGHHFFDEREAVAQRFGFTGCCFCAVIRPEDHPARPTKYSPLDAFWRGRGYAPLHGVVGKLSWTDLGMAQETEKPMQFWGRRF